jgi:alpha-beta hydrolase superfamily lysophospholipase
MPTDPMPEPLYIDAPGGPVFAVYHRPADAAPAGRPAVLFCAPWGWNETVSYHSRRTWAEALAEAGHPVLRFDLPAVGDSAGAPAEADLLDRWIAAVGAAATRLAELAPGRELVALGMELGGLLALEAARGEAPIDAIALWAMPKGGRGFVRTVQAFSAMQRWAGGPDGDSPLPEGWIEAAGFVLSAETSAALRKLKPTAGEPPAGVARFLVLGRDEIEPEADLVAHLGSAGAAVEADLGPGWDDMVLHPGYTVPPPLVMERLAAWLTQGDRDGVPPAAAVGEPADRAGLGAGSPGSESVLVDPDAGAWHERVLDGLPADSFGVLADPAGGAPPADEPVVLFLNAGAVRHIGPNRIWVDSARELAGRGVRSVRLDLAGIGEADGPSARFAEISEFYDPGFGDQVVAILDALERAGVGRRFVVVGLCSGGYWSFRVSLRDPRVVETVLLNPGALRWRSSLVMEQHGKGLGMLASGRLWKKTLRGEFEAKQIRAFLELAMRRLSQIARGLLRRLRGGGEEGQPLERSSEIEEDLDALRDKSVPAVLAFSQDEMTAEELRGFGIFDQLARWPNLTAVELPGVDHALASTSAQEAARELIGDVVAGDALRAARAQAGSR